MEIALVAATVGIVASLSGALLGWMAHSRDVQKGIVENTQKDTLLHADVEYIKRGVDDIRVEQRGMREDMSQLSDRVTRVEESVKSAHKRIDGFAKRED